MLASETGPCRDIVLLNAGAAIYVAGVAATLSEAIDRARQAIDSGAAQRTLAAWLSAPRRWPPEPAPSGPHPPDGWALSRNPNAMTPVCWAFVEKLSCNTESNCGIPPARLFHWSLVLSCSG